MLWLCLHLPDLSQEVFSRGARHAGPLAVVSGRGTRRFVQAADAAARALGVVPGLSLGAAHALAPGLRVRDRDEVAEGEALASLARWAGQFSPFVSLSPRPHPSILLEVQGSLGLFGGPEALGRRVESGALALGFQPFAALAPTPLAAELLARAGQAALVTEPGDLGRHLAPLGLDVLDLPKDTSDALHGLGVRTLGDCLRLPRAGLARRFGRGLLDTLDRALGTLPDPREPYVAPPRFESKLDLPASTAHTEALLFASHRLLLELEGFLRAQGAGVARFRLDLLHAEGEPTGLDVGLSPPGREPKRLLALLRERLERTPLRDLVAALRLSGSDLVPLTPRSRKLYPRGDEAPDDGAGLLERLRARLGEETVLGLRLVADHRPERASRETTAVGARGAARGGAGGGTTADAAPALGPRPLWLLEVPTPIPETGLSLRDGPERIESGWWDGEDVARDYFVAEDEGGARVWVYRERRPGNEEAPRWFLHGVFS